MLADRHPLRPQLVCQPTSNMLLTSGGHIVRSKQNYAATDNIDMAALTFNLTPPADPARFKVLDEC